MSVDVFLSQHGNKFSRVTFLKFTTQITVYSGAKKKKAFSQPLIVQVLLLGKMRGL